MNERLTHSYSLEIVQEQYGISPGKITYWTEIGLLTPNTIYKSRGPKIVELDLNQTARAIIISGLRESGCNLSEIRMLLLDPQYLSTYQSLLPDDILKALSLSGQANIPL